MSSLRRTALTRMWKLVDAERHRDLSDSIWRLGQNTHSLFTHNRQQLVLSDSDGYSRRP